jgi:hypothetical protein
MTIEDDALRQDLCAWIKSPAIGLRDYSSDRVVQRRVGRMLAGACAKFGPRAKEDGQFYTDSLSR